MKVHRYATKGPFGYKDAKGVSKRCEHVFVLLRMCKDSTGKETSTGDYRCEKCSLKRYTTVATWR